MFILNAYLLRKLAAFGRSPKGGLPVFGDDNACTYTLGFSPKGGLPESVYTHEIGCVREVPERGMT
jgi:hypothetical protein